MSVLREGDRGRGREKMRGREGGRERVKGEGGREGGGEERGREGWRERRKAEEREGERAKMVRPHTPVQSPVKRYVKLSVAYR